MAQLDRPGRAVCCISPSPTPSPTPYTPYVSPACELSNDDIENVIASMEAYMNDPDTDLPFPDKQTLDEIDNDCKDALTFEQKRRLKNLAKENFKDFNAMLTLMGALTYAMSSIFEDVYTNKNSRFLEDFGILLDDEVMNDEIDFGEPWGVISMKQQIDNGNKAKDKIAENLPNAIKNAIDNWVENGKLSLLDYLRLSVNRQTKDIIENLLGEDIGFVIGPDDLQKLKDSEWGELVGRFIENPNEE